MAEHSKDADELADLAAHIEAAVQEISASVSLRRFVRYFLGLTNVAPANSVFDTNQAQNAYNQGYQAAGMELAAILTSVEPRLVPTLLLEELTQNEQAD